MSYFNVSGHHRLIFYFPVFLSLQMLFIWTQGYDRVGFMPFIYIPFIVR